MRQNAFQTGHPSQPSWKEERRKGGQGHRIALLLSSRHTHIIKPWHYIPYTPISCTVIVYAYILTWLYINVLAYA